MALHSLHCAEVPLRNCSLTHSVFAVVPRGRGFKCQTTISVHCCES